MAVFENSYRIDTRYNYLNIICNILLQFILIGVANYQSYYARSSLSLVIYDIMSNTDQLYIFKDTCRVSCPMVNPLRAMVRPLEKF